MPVALLAVAALLLLLRVVLGVIEHRRPPDRAEQVDWRPVPLAAMEARATGRVILYDFTADWCTPCQAMQRELFADRRHARTLEQLAVPVRVLDRRREEGANEAWVDSLQRHHRVEAFPTLVAENLETGRAVRLEGYPGPQATLEWLERSVVSLGGTRLGPSFPLGTPMSPGAGPRPGPAVPPPGSPAGASAESVLAR
jgi:thiol-disulfide isomerase/thioredoxin